MSIAWVISLETTPPNFAVASCRHVHTLWSVFCHWAHHLHVRLEHPNLYRAGGRDALPALQAGTGNEVLFEGLFDGRECRRSAVPGVYDLLVARVALVGVVIVELV